VYQQPLRQLKQFKVVNYLDLGIRLLMADLIYGNVEPRSLQRVEIFILLIGATAGHYFQWDSTAEL